MTDEAAARTAAHDLRFVRALKRGTRRRIERQLLEVADKIRTHHANDPMDVDGREELWIKHFNLLKRYEELTR